MLGVTSVIHSVKKEQLNDPLFGKGSFENVIMEAWTGCQCQAGVTPSSHSISYEQGCNEDHPSTGAGDITRP